jgi:hypothetical protein
MSSEIKVSSVKAKDGTAGISIADSTGRVTFTETNPTLTLGSNTTFPTGSLVKRTIIKFTGGTVESTHTTHASAFDYQSVACTVGNTIVFDASINGESAEVSIGSASRSANFKLFQSTSSVSAGATSSLGTQLQHVIAGRTLTGSSTAGADSFFYATMRTSFIATNATHYFGISISSPDTTAVKTACFATSDRPLFFSIEEYKGDVLI